MSNFGTRGGRRRAGTKKKYEFGHSIGGMLKYKNTRDKKRGQVKNGKVVEHRHKKETGEWDSWVFHTQGLEGKVQGKGSKKQTKSGFQTARNTAAAGVRKP